MGSGLKSLLADTSLCDRPPPPVVMEDFGIWNCEEDLPEWEILNAHSDLSVPGVAPTDHLPGVDPSGNQMKFSVSNSKGRFFVLVFYNSCFEDKSFAQAFSDFAEVFRGGKIDVAGCSSDSISHLSCSLRSSDGWAGKCKIPLWSDPSGQFSTKFDMWDQAEGFCRDGLVIIDEAGVVRHAMTSSMEPQDTAKNTLELIASLRKHKVNEKELSQSVASSKGSTNTSSSSGPSNFRRPVSPVKLSREDMERDWDVSTDPELQKVLNKAKMLGHVKPAKIQVLAKTPTFELIPDVVRKLKNPKKGCPVRWCSATLHRNLTGFGQSGNISMDQKIKLENLVKKIMGVAYMPEDLTGKYTSLASLNQREQTKFLESDIFELTGDSWMKQPGAVTWERGQGVFVNNYSNFVLWVGLEDQLRFISVGKGTDLKYCLLRLQKAVARIEEALKMTFSTKSCNERGFSTSNGAFNHSKRGVYRTGFETTFTVDLPGFNKAEKTELNRVANDLFLDIEKGRSGSNYSVTTKQSPDDGEQDIVTRTVESVECLWEQDQIMQAKLGIKLDQTGRSL